MHWISVIFTLVDIPVQVTPNQPVAEGKPSTFMCKTPPQENMTRYEWKLDGVIIANESAVEYVFTPNRTENGKELSCNATTVGGVTSEKAQITLKVFCK